MMGDYIMQRARTHTTSKLVKAQMDGNLCNDTHQTDIMYQLVQVLVPQVSIFILKV